MKSAKMKEGRKIKVYRSEWKYSLTNQELSLLKSRIEQVMELDPHTPPGGRYLIHSLYFDDWKDTSVYTTDSGLSERFKWRIRYYGTDLSYIVLEKKEKLESRCHKKSCRLTVDEYHKIINGEIVELVYETDKDLMKELAVDMLTRDYRPKVIVDYERIAYVEEITNVRITFDMKISASYELDKFLDGDYLSFYVLPSGTNVLEVKFDDILPSYIRNIVESFNFKQTSFSKYYYCRKIMDCYRR
ncbi:MAG: polyphosphate polymerase domain-containing protein [Clostridia bacterium]|nr:polyphosphate polymerase domain-containing protein [Clostridia bacterium]